MESSTSKSVRSPLPDLGDLLFMGILSLIIWLSPNFLFTDGSTGWHLATGHYVLDHWSVPHTDLMSYTFPDRPWVPYEWLWDTLAAMLERLGGLNLVALVCGSIIAGLFACLYTDMRRQGLHFTVAAALTLIGSLVASIHWLARPLLMTWLGVYIFSRVIVEFSRGQCSNRRLWITLGFSMLVWVNSHPAFLLGFAIVIIHLVVEMALAFASADDETGRLHGGRAKALAIALAVIAAASVINPNGLQLFVYISHYLHQSAILDVTDEFNSPVFHGAIYASGLEVLFFALAFGLATSKKRPLLGQLLTVLAFGHLALNAKRNDPLFAIVSLPLIGFLLANSAFLLGLQLPATDGVDVDEQHSKAKDWLLPLRRLWTSLGATTDEVERTCNMHILPLACVALLAISSVANNFSNAVPVLVRNGFDPKDKPTATLAVLKERKLDPVHGFNLDNWGGYIRYKTGNRVFIDDRSDFYGQEFFQRYGRIAEVREGWDKLLDENKIEWILFPRNSYLAQALLEREKTGHAKFFKVAEDQASYLFVRKAAQ